MPDNLAIGFFAFGAVLILISLLGGGFNIFSFAVSTTISSPLIRVTSFILGTTSILMALSPGVSFSPSAALAAANSPPATTEAPSTPTLPPTQTSVPTIEPSLTSTPPSPVPTVITDTPTPVQPSPAEMVVAYWQNVSDRRYEQAWFQLSPGFRQGRHNNNFADYVYGYQQMSLCRIVLSNVNVTQQNEYSSVVEAHVTYYTGDQCRPSAYNFEMWLVYDGASQSWLFDKNILR